MTYKTLSGLSLRDIEYIVAVDDLRNFSRAAERCGVSQAGLSEQVRKLEAFLNVQLFERTRRHVAPTPDGVRIIDSARNVMTAARAMIETARSLDGPLEGVLRIGVISTLGPYYVPRLIPLIREKYPQLQLQLTEGLTDKLLGKLAQTELDMVLAALPCDQTNLESLALFFEPFEAVFPKSHPLAGEHLVDIDGLKGDDLLLLEDGHCLRDQALSLCRSTGGEGKRRLATSLEMLWHMIGAGEGYSLIPKLALQHRTEWENLITCRPITEGGRQIGMVWRASDPRQQAFREFGAFLGGHIPEGCREIAEPSRTCLD